MAVTFMLDRGSNVVLFKDEAIGQMAAVESDVPEDVVSASEPRLASVARCALNSVSART